MEDDVDDLHVEIELEMTWIAYSTLRGLEVSNMTWLLVEDDMDILHVEIKHEVAISFIRDIDVK